MLALDMLRGAADAGAQPTLDLNFTSGTLDSRVTYTGASLATLTDATGAIAYKPHNLLTWSGDLTNWNGANDGLTATTVVDSSSSLRQISMPVSIPPSSLITARALVAKTTGNLASSMVGVYLGGAVYSTVCFDTTTGEIVARSTEEPTSFSCVPYDANTWLISFSKVSAASTASASFYICPAWRDWAPTVSNAVFNATSTKSLTITALQINLGPLQPYYPTTGAAYFGPRFTYDPVTHAGLGLLVEEQRTNILLNSDIIGTNLSTQSVTTTATAYTLSFYGTGMITLSGTSTGAKVGTGAYPTRSTFTFTPTAGSLTLTIIGTVQYAQLEAGSFATSFIPTAGASVTRAADSVTMTGSNFSSWFNATQGTLYVEGGGSNAAGSARLVGISDGTTLNRIINYLSGATQLAGLVSTGGVAQANPTVNVTSAAFQNKMAQAYVVNNVNVAANGTLGAADTSATIPSVTLMRIGADEAGTGAILNGTIARLRYYNTALTNAQLQALTT